MNAKLGGIYHMLTTKRNKTHGLIPCQLVTKLRENYKHEHLL